MIKWAKYDFDIRTVIYDEIKANKKTPLQFLHFTRKVRFTGMT